MEDRGGPPLPKEGREGNLLLASLIWSFLDLAEYGNGAL